MPPIYPSTALKNQQREIKQLADTQIVFITENGRGKYVFRGCCPCRLLPTCGCLVMFVPPSTTNISLDAAEAKITRNVQPKAIWANIPAWPRFKPQVA